MQTHLICNISFSNWLSFLWKFLQTTLTSGHYLKFPAIPARFHQNFVKTFWFKNRCWLNFNDVCKHVIQTFTVLYNLILSFCLSCFPSLATNDPAPLTLTAKPWLRVTRRLSRDYKYVLKASYEKGYVSLRRNREHVHTGSYWQKKGWKILISSHPQKLGSSLQIGPQAVVVSPLCSREKLYLLTTQWPR